MQRYIACDLRLKHVLQWTHQEYALRAYIAKVDGVLLWDYTLFQYIQRYSKHHPWDLQCGQSLYKQMLQVTVDAGGHSTVSFKIYNLPSHCLAPSWGLRVHLRLARHATSAESSP